MNGIFSFQTNCKNSVRKILRWFTVCPTTNLTFDLHAAKVNLTGISPDGHDSCNNIKMFVFTYEVVTFSGETQCAALVGPRLMKQTTA